MPGNRQPGRPCLGSAFGIGCVATVQGVFLISLTVSVEPALVMLASGCLFRDGGNRRRPDRLYALIGLSLFVGEVPPQDERRSDEVH